MYGAIVAILMVSTGFVVDEGPASSATTARAAELVESWGTLSSPWFDVRREAERRLRHLPVEDGRELAGVIATSERPELRRAFAEWVRFRFERPGVVPVGEFERDLVVRRLLVEADPGVIDRLLPAAARDEEVVRRLGAARDERRFPGELYARLVEARLVLLLEDVMHEGRVPGFFDGQFAALYEFGDGAYEWLLRTALDPRVTFVVRALSVMALHEGRRPSLEAELLPLLIRPTFEYDYPNDIFRRAVIDTSDVQIYCACKLSQYARFSCAKAGLSRPIDEKIRALKTIAAKKLGQAETLALGLSGEDAAAGRLYLLEDAMDAFFELGYHHQQLDDYVRAELEYRTITERPEPLRVKSWAYYNLACIRAIQGRTEEAITEMERAVDAGFTDVSWARRDGDLAPLRTDVRFHRILKRAEEGEIGTLDPDEAP